MAGRFIWEWTLLSVPLVAVGLRYWHGPGYRLSGVAILTGMFFLLTVTYWPSLRHGLHHHPLDLESLPHGTTAFIQKQELKGSYAIAPSYAGYTEFALQDVKIHLDMQFPPFTSMDFQELNVAMLSASGLKTYVSKHSPDMLGVRKSLKNFPSKTAYELGYVPVFFDKKVVLFINKEKFQDTAKKFHIKVIDPFNEVRIQAAQVNAGITELERMLTVVDSDHIKLTLAGYLIEQGRISEAKPHLTELMQSSPDDLSTLYYRARFEHLSDNCQAAIPYYELTVKHSENNPRTHLQLAECYFLTGDLFAAYKHYTQGLNPYSDDNPEPLLYFQYALSAVGAGEPEVAQRLLTMVGSFAPDSELTPQISKMLQDLEVD